MIKLTDVTLRDGLQSISQPISTDDKIRIFNELLSCHYSRIEITSFSHPKWIPQLSDSDLFCEKIFQSQVKVGPELMAFVPNERGLDRCLKYPIQWVSLFSAVSETFHKKNVNSEIEEGLKESKKLLQRIHQDKKKSRLYLSTVFGCPYEGTIPLTSFETVLKRVIDIGADEIALSDTIGVAHPTQVREVLEMTLKHLPANKIALHFHNTYGLGIANVAAALEMGVNQFDGATGGLGGCPYAKGASGNLATEEIAYFLEREGRAPKTNWSGISKTLKEMKQCGLQSESHIASVLEKGGVLYGLK